MKELLTKLLASFDNHSMGMSARKLTAFALMVCVAYIHYKWITTDTAVNFLVVDLCAIFLLLGIVTAEQIIKLKNGKDENRTN